MNKRLSAVVIGSAITGVLYYSLVNADTLPAEVPAPISTKLYNIDLSQFNDQFLAKKHTLTKDSSVTFSFNIPSSGSFEVMPVRFEPSTSFLVNAYRCGLIFIADNKPVQTLITVGENNTEILSCGGMASIGLVNDTTGQEHLGIIYHYRSPNTEFSGGLVVSQDQTTQQWLVNQNLSNETVISSDVDSIPRLQQVLQP